MCGLLPWCDALRFVIGLAAGSFLNVVALRYGGDAFLFSARVLGGRSRCLSCRKTLRWYELLPLVSFVVQLGRCRSCGARVNFRYPAVEFVCGAIALLVPHRLAALPWGGDGFGAFLWVLAAWALLLIWLIDIRLRIIPDELNIVLVALGAGIAASAILPEATISFLGPYAPLLYKPAGAWASRLAGAAAGLALFGSIVWMTKGRAMGMGDVKLAGALGFLFGWPDVLPLFMIAFVAGAVWGVAAIVSRRATMKSAVPFGPFLVIGAAAIFFGGAEMARAYFSVLPVLLFG